MPRKGPAPRRELVADPIHRSVLVTQVINKVMLHGKRSIAEKIVYDALEILAKRTSQDPVPALEESIKQLTPVLEVRSRDVPFILEDGQIVGRLVYERMAERPKVLYGAGAGSNYQAQGLKLSKHFR